MLNWYDSYNGAIINIYRCVKLLIPGYRYAQELDSKVVQLIYLLQRVILKQF